MDALICTLLSAVSGKFLTSGYQNACHGIYSIDLLLLVLPFAIKNVNFTNVQLIYSLHVNSQITIHITKTTFLLAKQAQLSIPYKNKYES